MTGTNVSFRFSWEPASWGQSFKALFYTPPPVSDWFQDLETFDIVSFTKAREQGSPRLISDPAAVDKSPEDSCNIFHKAIAYLAKYSNPRLESILKIKFEELSTVDSLKNAFHSVLLLSLRTNRPKMLEVCQKVLSSKKLADLFNVNDVMELAKIEARVVPKPEHRVRSLSKALLHSLQQPFMKIRQIIRYIFSTTSQAYGVDFNRPPLSAPRAQGQWTFYRDSLHDICVLAPLVKTFFTDQWKTTIIAATILGISITAVYRLSEPPSPYATPSRRPSLHHSAGWHDDQLEQCSSSSESLQREPSPGLISCCHTVEYQLYKLHSEKEEVIQECNRKRALKSNWQTTEAGEGLLKDLNRIESNIELQKKTLAEIRKLALRLERLSQIYQDYVQKERVTIHFLNGQTENSKIPLEISQNTYLFMKYLALPEIRRESEYIISRCHISFTLSSPTGSRIGFGAPRSASLSALDLPLGGSRSGPAAFGGGAAAIAPLALPPPALQGDASGAPPAPPNSTAPSSPRAQQSSGD
ncbi:MAG: hypothetical protein JSS10_05475 [Verrucomicrobia bacterium]|nr:hypothetical protein [Verrucomicrobiota bacterium]